VWTRLAWGTLYAKLGLLGLVLVVGLVLHARLSAGPISLQGLGSRVAIALAERIGPNWTVTLRDSDLVLEEGSLGLRASGLEVRNPEGALVVRAPYAVVTVEMVPLLTASLQPRSIELHDLHLRASLNPDGSLSFLPAAELGAERTGSVDVSDQDGEESETAAPQPTTRASPVSAALSSLFELIVDPTNVVGALDRARVTNARLTLVDGDQRERVAFNRVDASFAHTASRTRRFDMQLHGAYGPWRINGQVYRGRGARRDGTIVLTEVPIHDLLLLSGLSGLPAATDLKLSGQAEASLTRGVLERLEARFETGGGTVVIDDKDTSPIRVDSVSASASWDEARRRMALDDMQFRAGDTDLKLRGELTTVAGEPGWRLSLAGKDALISGATTVDPPFKVDAVEAKISSNGRHLVFDRLAVQGQKFTVVFGGSYGTADGEGLRATVDAKDIDVRSALRLWPEGVASPVRRFLVPRLQGGIVEKLKVGVTLTPSELAHAMAGGIAPEKSFNVDFAIREAEFAVVEGAPAVSAPRAEGGVVDGIAAIRVPNGRIQMPDGRALATSDGSFKMTDLRPESGIAQIGFRLTGGADALASLMKEPVLQPLAGLDLDPSGLKGRTDLRVNLALPIDEVPDLANFPLTISGGITDVTVDKAFGREKLEGANLNLAYNRGSLNLRGEGRLGGTPATIEMRRAPGAAGELAVLLTLDEAARARRGFSAGSQLTGPIALRIGIPVGAANRASPRVEVDLAKAGIDNLIPGWTKPAGKPGRVTFSLNEGNPADIRDLAIESGPVQIRGTAAFSQDGILEKADISSLKFSPGDDMRAQLERSSGIYKVTVRGNVLDARPFLKSFTAAPTPTAGGAREREREREQREVELDLGVNIVTGFNDEALTGGTLKLATRNRDVRQLQMNGRFRAAPVSAQLTRGTRGPIILLQSEDAGATLRFADLYKRMVGGQLTFQITAGDTPQAGNVTIDGFALRNEPALRSIISQQPAAARSDDRGNVVPPINPNEVDFVKLKADFFRTANRLEFRDAVMWGMHVGFTLGGWIDYGRDRTDIAGTFVPAYGLNNMFSQVPVVGMILGGGRNEGLFAVNFRISGPASSPTLTVNPLSLVAPGFLRKFFGVGAAATDPTATMPPATIPR
jgi:hypothetical protein